jgi:hypothetical protein
MLHLKQSYGGYKGEETCHRNIYFPLGFFRRGKETSTKKSLALLYHKIANITFRVLKVIK